MAHGGAKVNVHDPKTCDNPTCRKVAEILEKRGKGGDYWFSLAVWSFISAGVLRVLVQVLIAWHHGRFHI